MEGGYSRGAFFVVVVGADGGGSLISGRGGARWASGRPLGVVAGLAELVLYLVDSAAFIVHFRVERAAARASLAARALGALAGLGLQRRSGVIAALLGLTRRRRRRRV